MNNNVVSVIFPGSEPAVVTFYLDDAHRYYANPAGVASSADGRYLFIACAGVDELVVLDAPSLIRRARELSRANPQGGLRLQVLQQLRVAVVPVGTNPRSLAVAGDRLVVANRLADTVQVVAAQQPAIMGEIRLGDSETVTQLRRGEILFNSAGICFQRQFPVPVAIRKATRLA